MLALVGPLSQVTLLVDKAVVAGPECFAALFTFEGPFPGVHQLVTQQLGVVPEEFAALLSFVELHASLKDQVRMGTECLSPGSALTARARGPSLSTAPFSPRQDAISPEAS